MIEIIEEKNIIIHYKYWATEKKSDDHSQNNSPHFLQCTSNRLGTWFPGAVWIENHWKSNEYFNNYGSWWDSESVLRCKGLKCDLF